MLNKEVDMWGYWANNGNATYWMVLPIQKMEGPWQCEICACCQPQGLQGWSIAGGGLPFITIIYVASRDHMCNFKDGR
jgi:hypothetical protein